MSINIHYLSNGEKSVYVVKNSGVTPVEVSFFEKKDDIPSDIRHYVPDEVKIVGPCLARSFRAIDILYPNFPSCGHPDYLGKPCIAEYCRFAIPTYHDCEYFKEETNNA